MKPLRLLPAAVALILTACASQPGPATHQAAASAIAVPQIRRPQEETAQWWFTAPGMSVRR